MILNIVTGVCALSAFGNASAIVGIVKDPEPKIDITAQFIGDAGVAFGSRKLSKSLKDMRKTIELRINKKIVNLTKTEQKIRELMAKN